MTQNPNSPFMRAMVDRGFFNQCTDFAGLDRLLCGGEVTAYAGFDATADSLHVGHLVTLLSMRRLAESGHRVIALVGGATSRVGDPSFRTASRPMMDAATIARNIEGISRDIRAVLGPFSDRVAVVNNDDWLGGVGFLDFMRDVGTHFTVARMLAMDSVRSRLDEQSPLTMMEFSYMMLQAADFAELARRHGCRLQLGGSDQWGNICNGIDLARRTDGAELFGLTTKLLTTADGQKMGKTAGGAVWLSPEKLTPFDFWQFWRNTADVDVGRFLLMFTDVEAAEVERLATGDVNLAKATLADEVTALVHGRDAAKESRAKAEALFSGAATEPTHAVAAGPDGMTLPELLVAVGMASSKSEARRLIEGGGVRIAGETAADVDLRLFASADPVPLAVGRKRRAVVTVA